jgi:hypothetical protein
MPGYYDWKLRNCTVGAITKAQSLLDTFEAVDVYLEREWADGGEAFTADKKADLAAVVEQIDLAEDSLEKAKHMLGAMLPGQP